MHIAPLTRRIHPLVAIAAGAVTLFSLVGIAAITGVLPASYGSGADRVQAQTAQQELQPSAKAQAAGTASTKSLVAKPASKVQSAAAPAKAADTQPQSTAVTSAPAPAAPTQTAQKPPPQNSPIGIGVGAVIGGALGNQVGSGDGKTLATIVGAIGGGYIGNEVAKKNQ